MAAQHHTSTDDSAINHAANIAYLIIMSTPEEPIAQGKQQQKSKYWSTVIEVRGRDRYRAREWKPDTNEDTEHYRIEVDQEAESAEVPGAEGDRFLPAAFHEEQDYGDEIGYVERCEKVGKHHRISSRAMSGVVY